MSLLTYGCPDPTKGRTEDPHITSIWGNIWLDVDRPLAAKIDFRIYNGIIDCIKIYSMNLFTQKFDVLIPNPSQFDQDFRDILVGYGIQFEEINY